LTWNLVTQVTDAEFRPAAADATSYFVNHLVPWMLDRIMKIDPKVYMYSDSEIICLDWTWTWILDLAMAVFAINFCFLSWNKVQQRIVSGLDALHCLAARNPG